MMKVKDLMEMLKNFDENDELDFVIDDDGDVYVEGFGNQFVVMEVNGKEYKL